MCAQMKVTGFGADVLLCDTGEASLKRQQVGEEGMGVKYPGMGGELTLGGGHTVQHTDDVLQREEDSRAVLSRPGACESEH